MLNSHSKVSIVQVVISIPILFLASFILYRNGTKPPRLVWLSLVLFSLIRLAGGIVAVQHEKKPSAGLTIATNILLSIGVVPLVLSFIGFITIILARDFKDKPKLQIFVKLSRIASVPATVHLVVGGILIGGYKDKNSASLGSHFIQAAYIVLVVITAITISLQGYLWRKKRRITGNSMIILEALSFAMPLFIVRIAYALISAYVTDLQRSMWNSVSGSPILFACMALLPEYLMVGIFIYNGFMVSPSETIYEDNDDPPKYDDQDFGTVLKVSGTKDGWRGISRGGEGTGWRVLRPVQNMTS